MSTPTKQSTNNYMVPASGGTHAVAFSDTLTGTPTPYDFRQFQLDNFPFTPQGCYCDNTANDTPATFQFEPIGLNISVPAQSFAVFNFPAPKGLVVNVTGGGDVTSVFVDYPVLPQIYYGNSAAQQVNVPAAPLAGAYLQRVIPSAVFEAKHARITGTAVSGVVTPANAANLRKLDLELSADSAMAAAGENTITVTVNGVVIYSATVVLPAAAGVSARWNKTLDFDNVAANSAGAPVTVAISTALSSGGLDCNAYFDA